MTKKITKATFKSFVKKNRESLLIQTKSSFDGMVDGIQVVNGDFVKAVDAEYVAENNLGIQGVWLVGGGRDYFSEFSQGNMNGIEVCNCCGTFVVAVQ
jgi:hypothetical protein